MITALIPIVLELIRFARTANGGTLPAEIVNELRAESQAVVDEANKAADAALAKDET